MFKLFVSAFTRPAAAFAELSGAVTWRLAAAVMACNLLAAGVGLPRLFEKTRLEYLGKGIPAEKAVEAAVITVSVVLLGAMLVPFFIWFLEALAIRLANLFFLAGEERSFGLLYRIAVLAWLPLTLGELTRSLLSFAVPLDRLEQVQTGLGVFFPLDQAAGFWYYLLSRVDPFVIWNLVLLALGSGVMTGIAPRKYGVLLFSCWAVLIVAYAFSGGNAVAKLDLQYSP